MVQEGLALSMHAEFIPIMFDVVYVEFSLDLRQISWTDSVSKLAI